MEIFEIVTYFVLLLLITTAVRVVTTSNVIHAAISLVFTLALTSVLFLLLSTVGFPLHFSEHDECSGEIGGVGTTCTAEF